MLETIREHAQGWIARIILGLIALTFAFWGVDSYIKGDGKAPPAAKVNVQVENWLATGFVVVVVVIGCSGIDWN